MRDGGLLDGPAKSQSAGSMPAPSLFFLAERAAAFAAAWRHDAARAGCVTVRGNALLKNRVRCRSIRASDRMHAFESAIDSRCRAR
jgi:hypothetical protein